jgi:DNA-directed RNA polymerase specialized sigma24 family protein
MTLQPNFSGPRRSEPASDALWINLYSFLRPFIKRLVFSSGISSWRGQEEDLVEDIVQETIVRVFKCIRRAEIGEGTTIISHKALSIVIARNYYEDLRRRDKRFVRIAADDDSHGVHIILQGHLDPSEVAFNNMFIEWFYVKFSMEAMKFSQKQRIALLIDLANRMDFDVRPTPLQKAFLEVGIQLQDYQRPISKVPVERSRHASNASLAYKRIQNWSRDNLLL